MDFTAPSHPTQLIYSLKSHSLFALGKKGVKNEYLLTLNKSL